MWFCLVFRYPTSKSVWQTPGNTIQCIFENINCFSKIDVCGVILFIFLFFYQKISIMFLLFLLIRLVSQSVSSICVIVYVSMVFASLCMWAGHCFPLTCMHIHHSTHTNMRTYTQTHTHLHTHTHTHTHTHAHLHTYTHTLKHVCVWYVCISLFHSLSLCVCVCLSLSLSTHICILYMYIERERRVCVGDPWGGEICYGKYNS